MSKNHWNDFAWLDAFQNQKHIPSMLPQAQATDQEPLPLLLPGNSRTIESFRLEKTFKIIESNCKPNTANSTTKLCP